MEANTPTYSPEVWEVQKNRIYEAIVAVEIGLSYAEQAASDHDRECGDRPQTLRESVWSSRISKDIVTLTNTLEKLKRLP